MRVKFLGTTTVEGDVKSPGEVVELDDELAKLFIGRGDAAEASTDDEDPTPARRGPGRPPGGGGLLNRQTQG